MHFQEPGSGGSAQGAQDLQEVLKSTTEFKQHSTNLPFGQPIPLSSLGGPSYVTTQVLVQQVAYSLSDRCWTYSPKTFDLDVALQKWAEDGQKNAYGNATHVQSMQTRQGGASIALGYAFSKDFDVSRRHIPQSIIASTSTLQYLHSALDELTLLYGVSSPFVAHIAALDYAGASTQVVADYSSALAMAEELGLGLVSSFSVHESQHMALFATLLAQLLPSLHIFDGVNQGRETVRVIDVLDQAGLHRTYNAVRNTYSSLPKRRGVEQQIGQLFNVFNDHLGTEYQPFEYSGHDQAETVLVAFGTVESSLASQAAESFAHRGKKIGVLNVRLCKPFLEDAFLDALPTTIQSVGVLGQVESSLAVSDITTRSNLYNDVVGAISFSGKWSQAPNVVDLKFPRETIWNPTSMAAAFQLLVKEPLLLENSLGQNVSSQLEFVDANAVQQYSFWDLDTRDTAIAATALGKAMATDSTGNVTTNTRHDNMILGGLVRTDIRKSKKTLDAAYSVKSADAAYVGDSSILGSVDILRSIKDGGMLVLKLPGIKDEDVESKLSAPFRKTLSARGISLYLLDPLAFELTAEDPSLEPYLVQACFLRVSLPGLEKTGLQKLSAIHGSAELFQQMSEGLMKSLRQLEVPKIWSEADTADSLSPPLPAEICTSSFSLFEKAEVEPPTYLKDWRTAALGLAFKEAYDTRISLRPDVSQQTYTIHVKENRRLTPATYDRNIFHIEFDLGDSGLKYEIGEALGIHAENDAEEVAQFVKFYKLDPEEIVEVSSRENPNVLENRTVYQALIQNIDIFGRPPKRFYEALSEFADDPREAQELKTLGGPEGANEFKRRAEVDTVTYADILLDFPSAHPSFHDIVRIVNPMKRREYSIASCQKVTPTSIALMIVVVNWVDPKGRDRWGQATRYLQRLHPGQPVTVSVKPSVMKLPPSSTQPLIMAGLGTGLAPFRAFVQHRALEKQQGKEIGEILLYMGSRHQREEYCYGEEWEAYQDAGVITLLGRAFSRDQPQKIYIQDRMRETLDSIVEAYLKKDGAFYLCGPTWPVPDVTNVLQEAIAQDAQQTGKKVQPRKEIDRLKEELRYVLEVY